jgi:plastocyanin
MEVSMRKWLALLVACLALGLVVGCGGDDDDDGGGGADTATQQEETTEASGGAEAGGEPVEVGMRDIKFDPETVTVPAGGTVRWTNEESVPHDVEKTSGPGEAFSSGEEGGMQEGDTFEVTLDEPGTYEYLCRVHAGTMKGTIEVE